MKTIKLTKGYETMVDDDDYEWLSKKKWYAHVNEGFVRARGSIYLPETQETKQVMMARVIMNAPKGMQVDHHNGNGLYNLKKNLRLATNQQNQFNRKHPQKNNKLGIKGVQWHKRIKKFTAQIRINGNKIHLGYFNVLGDADSVSVCDEQSGGE